MAQRGARTGLCRVCARQRQLTFEHVPPRRAYNQSRIATYIVDQLRYEYCVSPKHFPRGFGFETLCKDCNERTARLYGEAYFRWALQAHSLGNIEHGNALHIPFVIHPLRVIKQLSVMALACSFAESASVRRFVELRAFVNNPHLMRVPDGFAFYTYLCPDGYSKLCSTGGALLTGYGPVMIDMEVARRPLGYVVCSDSSTSTLRCVRDYGLLNITGFGNYSWSELRHLFLNLPVLKPRTAAPLCYESRPAPPRPF